MKAKPTTKEQLIYFLFHNISLGTYDKKFITNLVTMYVTLSKPVTTNQSNLLDKVVLRYERQLRKEEIDAKEMLQLPWQSEPVQSSPKFTEAYIDLKDDNIEVRSPFKGEFVKQFKELPTSKWSKETKVWHLSYCEGTLQKAINLLRTHYEKVNYCDTTTDILNTIESYKDVQYWNPTLVKSNGLFYIVASNNSLETAIKDIPLNDSLPSLARLTYHGITISRSVLNDISKDISDDDIVFAIERDLTIEYSVEELKRKLSLIGADYVLMREWNVLNKKLSYNLKQELEQINIKVDMLDRGDKPTIEQLREAKMPVLIGGLSFVTSLSDMFAKVIGLTNTNPIVIK